jgi:predicted membrane protein
MDKQEYTKEDNQQDDSRKARREHRRGCREMRNENSASNKINKGLIFILIGVFLFIKTLDLGFPAWVFSWQMLLIIIGCIVWPVSQFKNWGGLVVLLVGAIFFAKEYLMLTYDVTRFIWPAIFTIVGLALIFGKRQESTFKDRQVLPPGVTTEDYIDSSVIFSGENRVVVSKQFKGGKVVAIFGGADINMIQADFQDRIEFDATCIFGGLELIVPAHWDVRLDMHTIMGGVTDKRPVELLGNATNSEKIFVIKGTCIFGGIEIKNYI